jgi:ADP-heptose:LPS heptosyltransferase
MLIFVMVTNIVISRVDSIGDVILTLPLAGYIKEKLGQNCRIFFIGQLYTKEIIESCEHVDEFLLYDSSLESKLKPLKIDWFFHIFPKKDLALMACKLKIPNRVGTSNRVFHWLRCNHLVRFSRRKSDLHESQLNFKLLKPLFGEYIPEFGSIHKYIAYTMNDKENLDNKRVIIFHTMSNGSAVNWPFSSFRSLARQLKESGYKVSLTGTEKEGLLIREEFREEISEGICIDETGKYSLKELMNYIKSCHSLVAASTGPLHMASTLGVNAIGLYSEIRPMHGGRWAPIGSNVYLVEAKGEDKKADLSLITVSLVYEKIAEIG